jgi:hypothetical protein
MPSSSPVPQTTDDGVTVRESLASATATQGDTFFGRYRSVRELGRGGMGLVVLAHDNVLNVPVALKLIPELVVRDTDGILDLKKEVLRGMELTHPNIVRVFSFEQDAERALIVMEHVQGETLAQKKAQQPNRCFECDEILPWVEQLCAALDYAHTEARIAHRDLKPGNLLLTPGGRLKIADFGIASSLSDTMSRVSVRADSSGTPPYMSPQQAMGERPSHLDDIYSLGATIYELLTGKPPFFRGNILAQVMHEEPASMAQRRAELEVKGCADIPEVWERTVAACLAKNPDSRPNSGAAILAMLRNPDRSLVVSPPAQPERMALNLIPVSDSVPAIYPASAPKVPDREPKTAKLVRRRPLNLRPVMNACAALGRGGAELAGAVLRPIFKFALLIGVLWGALFLKQQWDTGQSKRAAAAAKEAAAQQAALAAAAPAPAPAPHATAFPPPPRLDRGPGPGPGLGGPGPGLRPPPPRR